MKDDYCHNGEENFNIYYRINQLDIDEKKWKRISKKKEFLTIISTKLGQTKIENLL